jgi:capsular exopolysaccharide synthesis family protein
VTTSPKQPSAPAPRPTPRAAASKGLFPIDSDTHLLDRLNAVYKYRHLLVTVFLVVMLGAIVRTYTTTPMYRATASLLIEEERGSAVTGFTTGNEYLDPEPYYQTQLRILTGRELATKVVARLSKEGVTEVTSQRPQSTALASLVDAATRQVQQVLRSLTGRDPLPSEGSMTPATADELVGSFLGGVDVEQVRGSRVYMVSVHSSNPGYAARAADTLAEEYVKQNFEIRTASTGKSLQFLADELVKQQKKVEDGERAMAQYREANNALSLEDRQNTVVSSLNQVNDQYTRARTERIQKEAIYVQVKSLPSAVLAESVPAVTQHPAVQSLRQRLAELQRERATLNERYAERHPAVIQNANAIEDATRQYQAALTSAVASIRSDYQTALSLERRLASALEEQKGAAMDLNRKSVSYTVLAREAESNREIYETLLKRQNELQILGNGGGNNVRMMDRAVVPGAPYSPDVRKNLLFGALVGAVLAFGLVLTIDYLDDRIKTPEDITRKLKLPFLGLIPVVRGTGTHRLLSKEVPHEFGEAFRALRTSLVFSCGTEGTRVIAVTSAQPIEGKTTTTCNVAIVLAFGGSRVLLIDADMRRPSVAKTLDMENGIGLSHLLTGQATARQAIRPGPVQNLWVMPAGVEPPNPSELLASDRMKALIANVQKGPFDWILIDTPPVLAVTDAVIIAPWVSGVVYIIGSEMTQRRLAERAVETLMTSRPHLLGAVLNRVDIVRNKYYYSRYYGYKYKNYYVKSPDAA